MGQVSVLERALEQGARLVDRRLRAHRVVVAVLAVAMVVVLLLMMKRRE
jgi:hypothetical protein